MAAKSGALSGGIPVVIGVVILVAIVFYIGNLPGASPSTTISTTPTTLSQTNQSATLAVNLQEEINDSTAKGFLVNQSEFYSSSASQCSLELIDGCDNNEPSQFICVNQNYSSQISTQRMNIYSSSEVCPDFMLAGTLSCALQGNYCVVMRSGPG